MTQRVLRLFVKPDGAKWLDLPLPDSVTVQQWWSVIRTESACVCDGWMCPYESILYAAIYQVDPGAGGSVVSLHPIDGGRAS